MDQTTITVDVPRRFNVKFDGANPHFSNDGEINLMFLRSVQNHMNNLLQVRGHLFLNEVLDELSIPRTYEGQLLGWATPDMSTSG